MANRNAISNRRVPFLPNRQIEREAQVLRARAPPEARWQWQANLDGLVAALALRRRKTINHRNWYWPGRMILGCFRNAGSNRCRMDSGQVCSSGGRTR